MTSISALVRLPLRAIPKDAVLRVVAGPARGARWIAGSSNHGCWLGTYERKTQRLLASLLRAGTVFYDIGANVGFFTVMAARRGAIVHAFEPDPANLEVLHRHVRINRLEAHVTVHPVAVATQDGWAHFTQLGSMGHLSDQGLKVRTISLDALQAPRPSVIKIDVEGAELAVLRGARQLIDSHRPSILFEPHGKFWDGEDVDQECLRLLRGLGYRCTRQARGDFLCLPETS